MNLRQQVSFFGSADTTRFCYLRVPTLEKAVANPRIVDGLLAQLTVPGKPGVLKAMSHREKLQAIEHQIDSYAASPASVWRGTNTAEVLAASIFRASVSRVLPLKVGAELWSDVPTEACLAGPVARWLKTVGVDTYAEVPLGTKRADVLGFRKGGLLSGSRSIVVELKNEHEQMKRGLDQMTTFAQYGHETYLACTPFFAAHFLDRHAEGQKVKHWDPAVLREKLAAFGFGLLLVEGEHVFEVMRPERRTPTPGKLAEVEFALRTARRI